MDEGVSSSNHSDEITSSNHLEEITGSDHYSEGTESVVQVKEEPSDYERQLNSIKEIDMETFERSVNGLCDELENHKRLAFLRKVTKKKPGL